MQRLFLLALMIGVSSFSSAQLLELNLQPYFYTYIPFLEVTDNQDIIIAGYGRKTSDFLERPYLAFIEKDGNLKWEFTDFTSATGERIMELVLTDDEITILGNSLVSCDLGGGSFIYKFDYEGNIKAAITRENNDNLRIYPEFACFRPNGELFIFSNEGYEVWASNDTFIHRSEHYQRGIKRVDKITDVVGFNDNFLISGYDFVLPPHEDEEDNCNFESVVIEPWITAYDFTEYCIIDNDTIYKINEVIPDSLCYLFGKKALYKYGRLFDNDYEFLFDEQLDLSSYDEVISIQQKENQVYLLTLKEEQYTMNILNDLLEIQQTIDLTLLPQQRIIDFKLWNENILLMGIDESYHTVPSEYYFDNSSGAVFLREYELVPTSSNSFPVDIVITSIESEQPTTVLGFCNQYDYSCGTPVNMTYRNIQVEVTNKGTVPIHSFNLNARYDRCLECLTSCGILQVYEQKIEGVNILPNDSYTVSWDSIMIRSTPMVSEHDLCIWTTVPNQKLDGVKENDMHCQTFTVDNSLVTALDNIETESMDDLSWKELISKGLTAQVYDINGRLIATLAKDQVEVEAFLNQLITGVYVLHFRGENYQRAELYVRYY